MYPMSYSIYNQASYDFLMKKFNNDKVGLIIDVYAPNKSSCRDKRHSVQLTTKESINVLSVDPLFIEWIKNPSREIIKYAINLNSHSIFYLLKIEDYVPDLFIEAFLDKVTDIMSWKTPHVYSFNKILEFLDLSSSHLSQLESGVMFYHKKNKNDNYMTIHSIIKNHKNYKKDANIILELIKS